VVKKTMQSIFDSLSNVGLRRLFKFAVKRAIGKYLENELLIDQLTVQSRDGVMSLSGLNMNCELLNNEVLRGLPLQLVEASIDTLEAKLSYTSLLSDGFQFTVRGVNIVIETCEPRSTQDADSNKSAKGRKSGGGTEVMEQAPSSLNADANDGMAFIANWLDVLVAGLKVTVEDLNVTIKTKAAQQHAGTARSGKPPTVKHFHPTYETGIIIYISSIVYFNSYARSNDVDTSVTLTERASSDADVIESIGAKKVCDFNMFITADFVIVVYCLFVAPQDSCSQCYSLQETGL
jgi:hypothetical protein